MKTSKRLLSILLMLTMLLSMFTVMASADEPCTHPNMEDVAYKAPTCTTDGCYKHKHCPDCGKDFDEMGDPFPGTFVIKKDPTKHEKLEKVEAKDPTCKKDGNEAYSYCSACKKYYDAAGNETTLEAVTLKANEKAHKLVKVNGKAATCAHEGCWEHQQCSECGKLFDKMGDSFPGTFVIKKDPANHEDLQPVAEKAATCTNDGNEAYSYCSACGKYYDADGKETTLDAVTLDATGHTMKYHPAIPADCTKRGTKEYWECEKCGNKYSDEQGSKEITKVVDPQRPHDMEKIPAKAATTEAPGNIEYYKCKTCRKCFKDGQGITSIEEKDTVIPQLEEEKHVLTINVPKVDNKVAGTVTYEGAELPKLEGLQNGDTRTLVAEAKDGYEFLKWEVTGATVSSDTNTTTTVKMGDTDATITAKFVKKTAPVDTFKLTVEQVGDHGTFKIRKKLDNGKWGNWWTAADDGYTSTEISNLKKGTSYQIKAVPGTNYEASWKVNNKTATVDNDIYTATINKNDISVEITFTKIDTKNLKLSVDLDERHGKLKYYDDDEEKWVTYDDEYWTLSKGDKVEFKAVPDSGYKAVWQLGSGSKTSATYYDVTYRDMDGKNRTLHVDFVKKSSSDVDDYPTLTFDITGGKHGTVYRGTREYEDGDVISIKKNDKMTFKAKTDKGYVAVWTYKGESYVGDEFTVKMGSKDAKLYVEFMDKDDIRLTELPFRDVSKRDWYYDDVVYVYRKGYMDGMSSTRFGGELNTTRGQIVTILWRLTGEPRATKRNPFTDVSSSQYYYDAISWAYDAGVVDGFDAHTFKPDQNVTREQLAAILYRYAKYMNLSTSGSAYLAKYKDADKIANWAYDAMAWANYRGLINGTSATRIDPKGYATRAQIAAILHRFAVEYGA